MVWSHSHLLVTGSHLVKIQEIYYPVKVLRSLIAIFALALHDIYAAIFSPGGKGSSPRCVVLRSKIEVRRTSVYDGSSTPPASGPRTWGKNILPGEDIFLAQAGARDAAASAAAA
ncbi:hypothetical protein PCANC_28610 [Puccinia coronata f. sp. avenae]|uniref:Uncharacterized protein n=1 Tax=Puccinia coronata f. sp. avenae TaxID=200324 RepID=A0A2N5TMV0_9BASI|nr:hypothetical protein PCANC_28610 [Puccinia coronata f. sp. avenae]